MSLMQLYKDVVYGSVDIPCMPFSILIVNIAVSDENYKAL